MFYLLSSLQTTSREVVSLAQFACTAVNVSYAIVMTGDITSEYSSPQTVCVFLPQGIITREHKIPNISRCIADIIVICYVEF